MKTRYSVVFVKLVALLVLAVGSWPAFGQSTTAFTYQGVLTDSGAAANGDFDLRFTLFDQAMAGSMVGSPQVVTPVTAVAGVFTVALDFGSAAFDGSDRWLEIAVRDAGSADPYDILSPRQLITPVPYALFAASAGTLTGNLSPNQIPALDASVITTGTFSAAMVPNLDAAKLTTGTLADSRIDGAIARDAEVWLRGGNAGTTPGVDFLGTTDNQPLEFRVNGMTGLLIDPRGTDHALDAGTEVSYNLVLGGPGHTMSATVEGAVIGGGGGNTTSGSFATISGGQLNLASGYSSSVGGGENNTAPGGYSALGGGRANSVAGLYGVIGGGNGNTASGDGGTVAGGASNIASGESSVVAGGIQNTASGSNSSIAGGLGNTASGLKSTVAGGEFNLAAGAYSFAAGRRAKANHPGAFVWGDASVADFASTGNNQFLIRANGGVGINKNDPATALDVNGIVRATGFESMGAPLTLGTTDNQPLEFRVNGITALIIQPEGMDSNDDENSDVSPSIAIGGPGNVLSTMIEGAIISGGSQNTVSADFSTVGGGIGNTASGVSANTVGGGASNTASGQFSTVAGGVGNTASGGYSTVGGGLSNEAPSTVNTVGGGQNNKTSGYASTVGGGYRSTASGSYSTVGGGEINTASGSDSTVGGGLDNTASGSYSTVSGGRLNAAAGVYSFAAGRKAKAMHQGAFVWGDSTDSDFASTGDNQFLIRANGGVGINKNDPATALDVNGIVRATGFESMGAPLTLGTTDNQPLEVRVNGMTALVIQPEGIDSLLDENSDVSPSILIGGPDNVLSMMIEGATLSGGSQNTVSAAFSTVGGGVGNTASGGGADTVGGGASNTASGGYSTVGGGLANQTSSTVSTVGGGQNNKTSGYGSTVSGGVANTASGFVSTVGGGESNTASSSDSTVAGGSGNTASGYVSTVAGGRSNAAAGAYSFAAGQKAKAMHQGAFVWGDSTDADFASTGDNQFLIRASGGVGINTAAPAAELHVNGSGWFGPDTGGLDASAGKGVRIFYNNPSDGDKSGSIFAYDYQAGTSQNLVLQQTGGNVGIGVTNPSHVLQISGVGRSTQSTWATTSDRRSKENIAPVEGSLARLERLRPVTFEYTAAYRAGHQGHEGEFTGFVAQEVEEVFPDMVTQVKEKIGEETIEDFRVLNTGNLTPHLVRALQELKAEKDAELAKKDSEISELKERLARLEALVLGNTKAGGAE